MPKVEYITLNSAIVSSESNLYIYNPANDNPFTYLLPPIVEGMRFKFVRNDVRFAAVLTIQATSPDTFNNGTGPNSEILNSSSNLTVIAKNGQWFVADRGFNKGNSGGSIVSAYFLGNNGNSYITFPSGTSLVANFYYVGRNILPINELLAVVSVRNTAAVFSIYLITPTGTAVTLQTNASYTDTDIHIYKIPTSSINYNLLPTTPGWLSLMCTANGNNRLSISSFIVR